MPPNSGHLSVVTARGNIISNDASGSQFRSGGTIDNNLFVLNPYPHNVRAPTAAMNYVTNNVYLEGYTGIGTGWGPTTVSAVYNGDNYNVGTITFFNNIIANAISSNNGIVVQSGFVGTVISNNILYKPITDYGTGTIQSGNNMDSLGTNNNAGGLAPAEPFWLNGGYSYPSNVPANNTVGTYYASIGNPGGYASTTAGFLSAAHLQSKSSWNPALTAAVRHLSQPCWERNCQTNAVLGQNPSLLLHSTNKSDWYPGRQMVSSRPLCTRWSAAAE